LSWSVGSFVRLVYGRVWSLGLVGVSMVQLSLQGGLINF